MCTMEDHPVINGQTFEIGHHYTDLCYVGEGYCGPVVTGTDTKNGEKKSVAIKKISPFENEWRSKGILREIIILTKLRHENVANILDIILNADSVDKLTNIYVVYDKMDADLRRALRGQRLSGEHVAFLSYQLMKGLKYIHSANIIHCDLKPANILVNADCELKISDFKLARVWDSNDNYSGPLDEYEMARWYRAPEMMWRNKGYTKAMDLWSVGCILGEMLRGRPLFPGTDNFDHLTLILSYSGTPNDSDIRSMINNEEVIRYISTLPKSAPQLWQDVLPNADSNAVQLLGDLLQFNPEKRPSVEEALTHSYFEKYREITEETICQEPFHSEFKLEDVPKEQLKVMIFDEIANFYKRRDKEQNVSVDAK